MIEIINETELEFNNDNDSEYERLQKMLNESDVSSEYSSQSSKSDKIKATEKIEPQTDNLLEKNYMDEFDQLFDMQKKQMRSDIDHQQF